MPRRYLTTIACSFLCVIPHAMALGYLDFMTLNGNRHAVLSCHLRGFTRSNAPIDNLRSTIGKPRSFPYRLQSNRQRRACQSSWVRTVAASSNNETPQIKTLLSAAAGGNPFYEEEEIIKKSRFIGIATHCSTWEDAQLHLERVRKDHPKSRHVCFGFVSGGGGADHGGVGTERCSDDGEPTGTAGVPILGAIKGEGLSDTLCIVVRYFGGIKLGAGGLIRAYGSTARLVLRSAPTQIFIPKSTIRLSTKIANSGAVYSVAAKFGGVTSGEKYNDRGEMELNIVCDEIDGEGLKKEIVDATKGGVMFL